MSSPSTPSPAWEQLYRGIRCLRIAVDSDTIVPQLLAMVDAARAADASQIEELTKRRDESDALIGFGKAAQEVAALSAQVEQLRDWQATVTAALRREGGAFYEDVPKHVRELRAQVEQLTQERDTLKAAIEQIQSQCEDWQADEFSGRVWEIAAAALATCVPPQT